MTAKQILVDCGFSEEAADRLVTAGVNLVAITKGQKLVQKGTASDGYLIYLARGTSVQINLPRTPGSDEQHIVLKEGGNLMPIGWHSQFSDGQIRDADVVVMHEGEAVYVLAEAWMQEREALLPIIRASVRGQHVIL